jgi:hypothetical protein
LAKKNELLTFDPLKDDPKLFLEKVLLRKPSLKNSRIVFQINNLPLAMIKTYINEIIKRIRYHMEMERGDLVNYFLEDMERLNNILKEESLKIELKNLKRFVE